MRIASTNQIEVPCGLVIWPGGLSRRCKWTFWSLIWSWEGRLMADGATQSEKAKEICFQEANQWFNLFFFGLAMSRLCCYCVHAISELKKCFLFAGHPMDMHAAVSEEYWCSKSVRHRHTAFFAVSVLHGFWHKSIYPYYMSFYPTSIWI